MAITDWPLAERPREKLLSRGVKALSDAELLAVFLRTGYAGKSAVDLARDLLHQFGSLRALLKAGRRQFCQGKGLGLVKYSQLQAVLEISRRYMAEDLERGQGLNCPEKVKSFLRSQLGHHRQEVFAVMFLNSQNQLLVFEELFFGTVDGATVYPREVVVKALHYNAASVILAHNHPSGQVVPSQADLRITRRLQDALALVDIKVLDHMVVGEVKVLSMKEVGRL